MSQTFRGVSVRMSGREGKFRRLTEHLTPLHSRLIAAGAGVGCSRRPKGAKAVVGLSGGGAVIPLLAAASLSFCIWPSEIVIRRGASFPFTANNGPSLRLLTGSDRAQLPLGHHQSQHQHECVWTKGRRFRVPFYE